MRVCPSHLKSTEDSLLLCFQNIRQICRQTPIPVRQSAGERLIHHLLQGFLGDQEIETFAATPGNDFAHVFATQVVLNISLFPVLAIKASICMHKPAI